MFFVTIQLEMLAAAAGNAQDGNSRVGAAHAATAPERPR